VAAPVKRTIPVVWEEIVDTDEVDIFRLAIVVIELVVATVATELVLSEVVTELVPMAVLELIVVYVVVVTIISTVVVVAGGILVELAGAAEVDSSIAAGSVTPAVNGRAVL
jgi:hypothetical protein